MKKLLLILISILLVLSLTACSGLKEGDLTGNWKIKEFTSDDDETQRMVISGQIKVILEVTDEYMILKANDYEEEPLYYEIVDGKINVLGETADYVSIEYSDERLTLDYIDPDSHDEEDEHEEEGEVHSLHFFHYVFVRE